VTRGVKKIPRAKPTRWPDIDNWRAQQERPVCLQIKVKDIKSDDDRQARLFLLPYFPEHDIRCRYRTPDRLLGDARFLERRSNVASAAPFMSLQGSMYGGFLV
jgi:hypothetical protein